MKRMLLWGSLFCILCCSAYADVQPSGAEVSISDGSNTVAVTDDGQMHVILQGKVDDGNSTTNPLSGGEVFTGDAVDISGYPGIAVFVASDVDSGTKGFTIEYSNDLMDWHAAEEYTYTAPLEKFYTPPSWLRYFRVVYSNGVAAQTTFDLHVMLHKSPIKWSSHNVEDAIVGEDDAELVVAVIKAKDPSGVYDNIQRSPSGNLLVSSAEDPTAIAFGDVVGKSIVQKFGNAPDFDTGDGEITVWDGAADNLAFTAMQYPYSTSADIQYLSATSTADTQIVTIQGLDASTNLVTQTATVNGTNVVTLTTPLLRVFRMENDGATDMAGRVFLHTTPTPTAGVPSGTEVRAIINNGNNQTEMTIYTVPADTEIVIKGLYFYSAGAKKSAIYLCTVWSRSPGGVFKLKWKGSFNDDIESGIRQPYETGLYFDEGTDIELRVEVLSVGVTEATISAGFEIETKEK
jgi:hypothetical protein